MILLKYTDVNFLRQNAAILILKNMLKWRHGKENHKTAAWQFAGSGE
jgi:hypothetical protein